MQSECSFLTPAASALGFKLILQFDSHHRACLQGRDDPQNRSISHVCTRMLGLPRLISQLDVRQIATSR